MKPVWIGFGSGRAGSRIVGPFPGACTGSGQLDDAVVALGLAWADAVGFGKGGQRALQALFAGPSPPGRISPRPPQPLINALRHP